MTAHQKVQRKTLRRTVFGTLAAGTVAVTTGLLVPTAAQASVSAPNTDSTVAQESAPVRTQSAGTFPSYSTCRAAGIAAVNTGRYSSFICSNAVFGTLPTFWVLILVPR